MNTQLIWLNTKKKVSDIIPYERNPRKITEAQIEYLKKSLYRFNLVDVPIIDFDGVLISGHQRCKALSLLGRDFEEIDVRIPNRKLTEKEFKDLNLELNKLRGTFDFDILGADFEMEELKDLGFDNTELGLGYPEEESLSLDNFDDSKEKKEHTCPSCGEKFTD